MTFIRACKIKSAHNNASKATFAFEQFLQNMMDITDKPITRLEIDRDHQNTYKTTPCFEHASSLIARHFDDGANAVKIYVRLGERSVRAMAYFNDRLAIYTASSPDHSIAPEHLQQALNRQLGWRRHLVG